MKLSLTHYGETITIESDRDALHIDEVVEMVRSLLIAAGFAPETVNAAIDGPSPAEAQAQEEEP